MGISCSFVPKYRRKAIYKELRKLCNEKKVEIIEAELCSDHVHMYCDNKYSRICGIYQEEKPLNVKGNAGIAFVGISFFCAMLKDEFY